MSLVTLAQGILTAALLLPCTAGTAPAPADSVAPGPSPVIEHIAWAPPESVVRLAKGSDNFPLAWGDDDALYTAFGDGWGFEPRTPEKLGLGFARITGTPPDHRGFTIRSTGENRGQGRNGKKGSGLIMVDGVLYLWLFHADEKGAMAQLAHSTDHARTWTEADWRFEEFGLCTFISFGRDGAGARDEYVYSVSHDGPRADTPADRFVLMRVPRERIADRKAYEFLKRVDERGDPVWTPDVTERGSVFANPGACLRSGISYCAPLGRYLWWQQVPNRAHKQGDCGDTRFEGGFGIFDAPEPWGPWTVVFRTDRWDMGPGERAEFPPKWMAEDGRTLRLAFSGEDSFSVREATLTLRPQPGPGAAE